MTSQGRYAAASIATADHLRTIAQSAEFRELSHLTLPEVEAVVDLVGQIMPAGNIPGVILSGLARLPGRRPPPDIVERDVNLLLQGVQQVLDKAAYGALFAGPAAVLWGYQNLIKLAGKTPEDSFPEGTWQFYVDYALREDTARHTNETHGFDTVLRAHQIELSPADRITAWIMTCIHILRQYDDYLANEWRERVYTRLLADITAGSPEANRYNRLYRDWQGQLPYSRGSDATISEPYPIYRRIRFDRFLAEATRDLPTDLRHAWEARCAEADTIDLPAYQRQMSLLGYLNPGSYREKRTAIPFEHTHIGVIVNGHYYLIPACKPASTSPLSVTTVREQVAALLAFPFDKPPAQLRDLALTQRATHPRLRQNLRPELVAELDQLRLAPILLNCDARSRELPLAQIRQAERGVGDHALTIFTTGETFIFDQSHIYFDGAWGAALAEIMTNEALAWAVYLNGLPPAEPGPMLPYSPALHFTAAEQQLIHNAPCATPEASAETDAVNVKSMLALRKLFRRRNDLIQLTVNDLLVLYRAIHAVTYHPPAELVRTLEWLAAQPTTQTAATEALAALQPATQVPATLIPVDASQQSPRDRLYPMTFEVPLADLNLLHLHATVLDALDAYEQGRSADRAALYTAFDSTQRQYLAILAGFGAVLTKAKDIALAGESTSVGTIKLLAHMPAPLQRLLDQVPGQLDMLNDILKGREVFSNVGAVAKSSTLTRFITAKDDNNKKTLAWGIITDAQGVMRISLRDFRPYVAALYAIDQHDLAHDITQAYLDDYAAGLNNFVRDLHRITHFSRETRLVKPEETHDW